SSPRPAKIGLHRMLSRCRPPGSRDNLGADRGAGDRAQRNEEAIGMSTEIETPLNWYTGGVPDTDVEETEEWLTALEDLVAVEGRERRQVLLKKLLAQGYEDAVTLPCTGNTPYINTIPVAKQPAYPGDRAIERRIKSLVRWNAMALVVRANKKFAGLGGHISTFASAATLYQV